MAAEPEVSCVYDLPVPLTVDSSVFGHTISTVVGEVAARVVTPEFQAGVFTIPALPGVPPDASELADRQWASSSPALDEEAFQLRRVGLILGVRDREPPAGRPGAGPSVEGRLIDAAFSSIDTWFDRLRSWVEVVTGQDLDPQSPLFDAWIEGAGLRAWRAASTGLEVIDKVRVTMTHRGDPPLPVDAWRFALHQAGDSYPPIEHLLMRDARASLLRGQTRRAVLDAGAAAELALIDLAHAALLPLPEPVRAAVTPRYRTLGNLVTFVKSAELRLPVPASDLDTLVRLRNAATHRVARPAYGEALGAVNTAQRLIEHVRPLADRA